VDGRTLEARIRSVESGSVRMERADGAVFTIPVERFVEEDRRVILAWKPREVTVPEVDDAVLVLETDDGRGSGFLVQTEGLVWVYTNQHVIGDAASVRAEDTSGREIELGRLEIAGDRDVARFVVEEGRGLLLAGRPKTGDSIIVYGNSQGSGMITRSEGELLGISADALEVSAEIVSGNSGGPVVDEEGAVLGISTYVQVADALQDPTMKDTRYEKPRRFALRLDEEIDFRVVSRWEYQQVYDKFREETEVFDESLNFTRMILSDPSQRIMTGHFNTDSVIDIVEEHNDDVARLPGLAASGISYRSKIRKFSKRYIDTLEEAYQVGASSLEDAESSVQDERFGWMKNQIRDRKEFLSQWYETIERVEKSFD
ncbi:MAG: S1 family peptidase, partial [Puniceicoccales bacterium]